MYEHVYVELETPFDFQGERRIRGAECSAVPALGYIFLQAGGIDKNPIPYPSYSLYQNMYMYDKRVITSLLFLFCVVSHLTPTLHSSLDNMNVKFE